MKNHDLDAPISTLRRKLMLGLPGGLALSAPFALVSCGGSDGTEAPAAGASSVDKATIDAIVAKLPAVTRSALKVGVTLPAGSGAALASTTLLTTNSNAQVADDGSSAVVLINASPQMAYLFGSDGKLLLMGVVEPGVRTTVDSRSTAEALIHIASEASLYGIAIEVALREVLRTHAIVEPVRLAVEAALKRDGIDSGDAALMQAVATAVAALRAPKAAPGAASRLRPQGLTTTPDAKQSGLTLTPLADAFNTIVLTNTFRRRLWVWVAQTSYVDQNGTAVPLPAPIPFVDYPLRTTDALSFESLVTTVGDYVVGLIQNLGFLRDYERGTIIFNPVTSKPLELPILPNDDKVQAKMAVYRTRVVGPARADGPARTAEEEAKLQALQGEMLWNDIILPVIKNLILPIISVRVDASLSNIASQLLLAATVDLASLEVAGTYFPATVAAMRAGDAKEVLLQFFAEFFTSNTWSKILETAFVAFQSTGYPVALQAGIRDASGGLVKLNLLDPEIAAQQISGAMTKFAKVIIVIKGIVMVGDYAALADDWDSSKRVTEFSTEVSAGKISLSPDPLLIDGVAVTTAITAKVEGLDAGLAPENVFIHWKCSGKYGDLYQRGGNGLNDFQTLLTNPAQDYISNGTKDDPATPDTIDVTAFYRSPTTNQRVEIGSASVKVKFKKAFNLGINPLAPTDVPTDSSMGVTAFVKETLPEGSTAAWEWSHTGVGSIESVPADSNPNDSSVAFKTTAEEGTATVTARATFTIPATATTASRIVIVDPISTTLNVKKGLKTITVEGYFQLEQGSKPSVPPICGLDAQGKEVCLLGYLDTWVTYIVPKVANAESYSIRLLNPTGGTVYSYAVPSTYPIGGTVVQDGGGTLRIRFWGAAGPYSSYDGVSNYAISQAQDSAAILVRARNEIPRVIAVVTLKP